MAVEESYSATPRLRTIVGIAGGVYLLWWFAVELLLPGSFNPLGGRLVVVAICAALYVASRASPWVDAHLSGLFTAWVCLLVAHYAYLIAGNHGDSTWWVGAFVTFAASSMCLQSPAEVAVFSVVALACVSGVAVLEGQLRHSIYLPGLATILLLANITKRSQVIAQAATLRADRARRQSEKADEQRLQLAAIVESSGDAIIAIALDGRVVSWNKGAEALFGHASAEAIGRPITMLAPEGLAGEEPSLVARVARGESVRPFETVRRRKDGTDVDVSITISPVRDAGVVVGASLVARDISDRKRAQSEAMRAQAVAEAANQELEAFSYSVAHDLRAPLRSIDGFSNVLQEDYGPALDAAGHQHLRRVRDAAQHMGQLIDSLLALGRVTRVNMDSQRVDLSALARACEARLREAQPDRAVQVTIEDGLWSRGDAALLGVVVDNLLSNAWKFTKNRPSARIEVGRDDQQGQPAYFVRDNGAGFDMRFASKLFTVFQRLHPQADFEGTGVGLATVQRIVQRHGGRVWAEGKIGEGACFRFTLHDGGEA